GVSTCVCWGVWWLWVYVYVCVRWARGKKMSSQCRNVVCPGCLSRFAYAFVYVCVSASWSIGTLRDTCALRESQSHCLSRLRTESPTHRKSKHSEECIAMFVSLSLSLSLCVELCVCIHLLV